MELPLQILSVIRDHVRSRFDDVALNFSYRTGVPCAGGLPNVTI